MAAVVADVNIVNNNITYIMYQNMNDKQQQQ